MPPGLVPERGLPRHTPRATHTLRAWWGPSWCSSAALPGNSIRKSAGKCVAFRFSICRSRGLLLSISSHTASSSVVLHVSARSIEEEFGLFGSMDSYGRRGLSIAARHCWLGESVTIDAHDYRWERSNVVLLHQLLVRESTFKTED